MTFWLMLVLWLVSLWRRNASIVDAFWGPGFSLIAIASFLLTDGFEPRRILITAMAVIWGGRLGIYILWRNWGHGEDFRYAAMREHHGERFWWRSLFTVFALQGILMWIISMPLQLAQLAPAPGKLTWFDFLGLAVWLVGFVFEAGGDWQLARFKADPANRGKVMDRGLWRYTRHPNYFGDAAVWWGHWLVAAATPMGRWTVLSPALMNFLVRRVSGVTLLESTLDKREGYRNYVERTSAFLPWPPRRAGSD
jgi:steroid 5-alpha reductase family enzyme